MAITALLFLCFSLFLALYLALLKQGQKKAENRATERIKSCDSGEKAAALKKSRKQDEEEEEADLQFPATKLQQPCSEPDSGVSSFSNCEGISSSNKKFEVFISHRGPDTKGTLAHHIYDLLHDRGVEAFLDKEELQSGERFPLAIQEAIACSKVDVCILSSGFAESVWCLKELQMMVDKYERGKSKLIPIFYDVTPSDVRRLQGTFGEGFQKKIIDKNRYSTQVIDKWKQALCKIADITGEEGKGECCMAVVNKILDELDVGLLVVPDNLVGREKELRSIKQEIMRRRQNGCSVTSVEISGVGGIGKTTFAKQLYNQICPQYKRCCFIEDVGGLVKKYGVNEVHNQLISKLFRYKPNNMRMEGKKFLKDGLHNAEILVVLDNIHSEIPLSKVFIEDDVCLSPRSIIITTSREKAILKHDTRAAQYCQNLIPLELSFLDFHISKELFCRYAFRESGNVSNEFNELIEKIVKKCHGVPLALTVLGSLVYRKEIEFWENLSNSIKKYLHPKVQKILKISYENLDSELQKCLFLDVATFLRWEKVDFIVELRRCDKKDGESDVLLALDVLEMKNLIKIQSGVLMMHDVLVDLGRSIVQDEDSCPGRRSRVWDPSDVRQMLSDDERGTEKVKGLTLVSEGLAVLKKRGRPWPADAFRNLSSLEFLILQGDCIKGDFSKLSKRLLWLKWIDFPWKCIPPALCLKRVKILHVSGEKFTLLWKHHPEKEAPTNIRQLSLPNCMTLQRLPEFIEKFRHLSCIDLSGCTSLQTIPDSFCQLKALKRFQLARCKSLVRLPDTFGDLTSLCELDMSYCFKIKSLPESFSRLSRLERLLLNGCKALEHLPKTFGGLTRLCYLSMCYCFKITLLPDSFAELSQLKELWLTKCKALKCLPESLGYMLKLEELGLSGCLEHLPESFVNLSGLKNLDFSKCQALKHLPESFGHLQLKTLYLNKCLALEHLPKSFGHLPHLETLKLQSCWKLEELPDSIGNLQNLRDLWIDDCIVLKKISLGNVSSLTNLAVNSCWMVEVIDLQGLLNLQKLQVVCCFELTRIVGLSGCRNIREIMVQRNPKLTDMPGIHGCDTYKSLTSVSMLGCYQLCLPFEGFVERLPNDSLALSFNHNSLKPSLDEERLPNELCVLSLSLNQDSFMTETLPNVLQWSSHVKASWFRHLHTTKTSPLLFAAVEQRVRDRLSTEDRSIYSFHELSDGKHFHDDDLDESSEPSAILHCLFNLFNHLFDGHRLCDIHVHELPDELSDDKHFHVHELSNDELSDDELSAGSHHHELSDSHHELSDDELSAGSHHHELSDSHHELSDDELSAGSHVHESSDIHELPDELSDDNTLYPSPLPDPEMEFRGTTAVLCFVSGVYAANFPMHIPLPETTVAIQLYGSHEYSCFCFGFGEVIHMVVAKHIGRPGVRNYALEVKKREAHYPSYEALVKEGWLIFLDDRQGLDNEILVTDIFNIFYSELRKQRRLSHAWTELPSQLCIFEFSALDLAGCQITKIYRHYNTYIMEEESGLTWNRRRCLFTDDHALLLEHPTRRRSSKHSFLAYPGLHLGLHPDLEAGAVANLYEMSICMSNNKGELIHSRKLQEIVSINQEQFPPALNTLLQTNASSSRLATVKALHRKRLMGSEEYPQYFW